MTGRPYDGYTLVVLFGGSLGMRLGEVARRQLTEEGRHHVRVAVPPLGGVAFLSSEEEEARALKAWWVAEVGARRFPMMVAMDETELPAWIAGTEGAWFVGVADDQRALAYRGLQPSTLAIVTSDPAEVLQRAMQALSSPVDRAPSVADRISLGSSDLEWGPALPQTRPSQPFGASVANAQARVLPTILRGTRRIGELSSTIFARRQTITDDGRSRLGMTVNAHRPILVAFGSRKGGVGKTTHAAGVAATVGEMFSGMPDTAALVDANIVNPDSWALNPAPGAATVRTMISCLAAGQEPPHEMYAATPRLAIYPESREGADLYTRAEIDIFAAHLRRRHSFVAVDLPNTLPSLASGGAPSVTASWLAACDVVVLPFDADPRARQGLLEYIDVLAHDRRLMALPVVAAYTLSRDRRIAADARVVEDVDAARRRGAMVVEIPDDDRALLALLQDRPITDASPALRRAFHALTEAIVEAVITARAAA